MNIFDSAKSIHGLIEMKGFKQIEVAEMLGVSQSFVANKLRLLNIPDEVKNLINENGLTERHARCLLRLPKEKMMGACLTAAEGKFNVRETEILVDTILEEEGIKAIGNGLNEHEKIAGFERSLEKSVENLKSSGICAGITYKKRQDKLIIEIAVG